MKKLKKILCILNIISVFLGTVVSVSALAPVPPPHPDLVKISFGSAVGGLGDILSLAVKFSNVHSDGLSECNFKVDFDGYDFEILNIKAGEIVKNEDDFKAFVDNEKSAINFSFKTEGNELIKSNGEFAQITVRIKPTAIKGVSFFNLLALDLKIFEGERINNNQHLFLRKAEIGEIDIEDGTDNLLKINVGTVEGNVGDVVEIPVSISNVPPLYKLRFAVNYDTSILDIISVSPGKIISDLEVVNFSYTIESREYPTLSDKGIVFNYIIFDYNEKDQHERNQQLLLDGEFAIVTAKIKATNQNFSDIKYYNPSYKDPANRTIYITQIAPQRIEIEITDGGVNIKQVVGDLNGDGIVNSSDYVILKRYILEIIDEIPVSNLLDVADFNLDGIINSIDLTILKRFILGIIDKLPLEE